MSIPADPCPQATPKAAMTQPSPVRTSLKEAPGRPKFPASHGVRTGRSPTLGALR